MFLSLRMGLDKASTIMPTLNCLFLILFLVKTYFKWMCFDCGFLISSIADWLLRHSGSFSGQYPGETKLTQACPLSSHQSGQGICLHSLRAILAVVLLTSIKEQPLKLCRCMHSWVCRFHFHSRLHLHIR